MVSNESKEAIGRSPQEQLPGTAHRLAGDLVLWLALALAVVACLLVYYHIPYVNGPRGPKQWRWPYSHRDVFLPSLMDAARRLALGGIVTGAVTWLIRRFVSPGTRHRCCGLIVLFCWGVFFVWTSLMAATPRHLAHLARVIKSPTWTSYFNLAQWIQNGRMPPLGETLPRYEELLPQFPLHASTHPPGAVMASYGVLRLFENHPALCSAMGNLYQKIGADPGLVGVDQFTSEEVTALTLGFLAGLLGQLGIFPVFWLARRAMIEATEDGRESEAERTAWVAAVLWAHYPALVLMIPAFDLIYPAMTLLCIYFTMRGLEDRPVLWGVALALLFMLGITFTFTLLLLVPMLCLLAWLELSGRAGSLRPKAVLQQANPFTLGGRRLWVLTATAVVTCLILEFFLRYAFRIHLMRIFFAAVQHQNSELLAKLNRTYEVWVFYNVWDFLFFAGMPLTVLAVVWFARAFREWWRDPATMVPSIAIFPLAILMVDLSHQLSAETARVWLFLAPGIAWAGAAELVRRSGKGWRWVLVGVLLLQTVFIYICRTNMQLWGF